MWSTATQSKASSTFESMLPREVMQPCLLLQMKCRTGLMRLPLINKERYISSIEAVWRLLNFPIHQRYPTVAHLAVHLEGGQRVYYEPGQPTAHLTNTPPKTTLTAFFYLCKTDPLAKKLLYSEVPRHFRWDAGQKDWQIRKKVYLLQTSRDM
ncbi:ATP-dependent DNA helicase [Trichonephila clavata]|uniref:ATP-dependent DNA helicase n=1 Tax=Trichonephila clavata TaxID=2740835 RepID=A0A8X6KTH5_TRICU|nr:ATP-dependent DNA helicase [Trichonephila clavata]